ncbi:MAG: glycosyltransferase family 39 protein [Acidobacteriota bacterium]|nr:glycosyltransferase family 39 protein [Acidobacteriota bacterium]
MARWSRESRIAGAALFLLVGGYGALLICHASRAVGGSDSSGYYNEARAVAAGRIVEPLEPLTRFGLPLDHSHYFIPLGYSEGPAPGTMAPSYPVGLPLHFCAAASILGWNSGPFLVSPVAAAVSLLLIYLVARELGLSRTGGLACTAMFACVPILVYQGVQPMSDAVATAWALGAVLFALRARKSGGWAAGAGLAFGAGVLVRPSSAVLIVPLVFALPQNRRAWLLFLAGGAPCAAILLAFNRAVYGGILKSGYDETGASTAFSPGNAVPGLRHYGYWISVMMSPIILPCWIAACLRSRAGLRDRLLLFGWFAAFLVVYVLYFPYEAWWYTRFLLPAIPALLIGAAMAGQDLVIAARGSHSIWKRAAAATGFLLVCGAGLRMGWREQVLEIGRGQAIFPEAIRWSAARVPREAIVLSMEFSGAMKAYGWGTPVRWDWIENKDFAALRRRLESPGHPLYALLLPHEVVEASGHLPGTWRYLGSHGPASLWILEPAVPE